MRSKWRWIFPALGLWLGLCGLNALGQRMEPTPQALEEVGIDEKLDAELPLQMSFRNGRGGNGEVG